MRHLFPYIFSHPPQKVDYLTQRDQDKIKSQWRVLDGWKDVDLTQPLLLISPTDEGVMLNGGRWGSRYAPSAIMNQMKNFHIADLSRKVYWQQLHNWQEPGVTLAERPFFHLGGGHDTLYDVFSPFLAKYKDEDFLLINIDAHTDTRKDEVPHSGNPIARLAKEHVSHLKIWQIGIHPLANSPETLKVVGSDQQRVTYFSQHKNIALEFDRLQQEGWWSEKTRVFLSIDFDAFTPEYAQGVSAPNGRGLPWEFVYSFLKLLQERNAKFAGIGIYEYNPLYDSVSAVGAKAIAQFILSCQYW